MKTKIIIGTFFLIGLIFTSCSNRLIGTWTIKKYETTADGKQAVELNNIGTMTFNRGGVGEKDITYTIFGIIKEDKSKFQWTVQDNYVKIESEGSDFSKKWIIIYNNKNSQKWKSIDQNNQDEILELAK